MADKFWIENPSVLIKNYDKFLPNRKMTIIEQLNSITLFCIYSLILLKLVGLLNNVTGIFFIGIIVILVILYFNKYNKGLEDNDERFEVQNSLAQSNLN